MCTLKWKTAMIKQKHRNAFSKWIKYSLLKLCAMDQRVSISNQSWKRVSLRGEQVPPCCYLCRDSALVDEGCGQEQWRDGVPGSHLYPRTLRRPHPWAVEDVLHVTPRGGVTIAEGNDMKGCGGADRRSLTKLSKVSHWLYFLSWWSSL